MKCVIIANPGAGSADSLSTLREAVAEWTGATLELTEESGDGTALARKAIDEGADLVIAAGGDGTVHEVVNGLAIDFSAASLAVVPLGTGNDLARTLEMPRNPLEALDAIRDGVDRPFDILRAVQEDGSEVFVANVLSGGLSGKVTELLTAELKERFGPLAYLLVAPEALAELPQYEVRLSVDGKPLDEIDALGVHFANGRTVGGGFEVAPGANPEDGLMDVVIVHHGSALDMAKIAAWLTSGDILSSESVDYYPAVHAEIFSSPPMPFNADGEPLASSPREISILPEALKVRVPRNK